MQTIALECPARALRQIVRITLTFCLLSVGCASQQSTPASATPDEPSTSAQEQKKPGMGNPIQGSASFVRILAKKSIVFPDLATNTGPLSPQEKFKLFVNNSISLSTIVSAAGGAGMNQALNTPAGFGQGGEGYAKRFGSSMARNASSQFVGTFLLASALHEDPRFFVRELNFGDSVKYSIRRVFLTRSDSGERVFNWSGLLGPLAAEGLANVYFPDNYRTAQNTFSRYGYDIGWIAAGNLLKQYWPSISRKLKLLPQEPLPVTSPAKH